MNTTRADTDSDSAENGARNAGRIVLAAGDVDYSEVSTPDLRRLADMYTRHHADARDAWLAGGKVDGDMWDDAMRRYMDHQRAIDTVLLARREADANVDTDAGVSA